MEPGDLNEIPKLIEQIASSENDPTATTATSRSAPTRWSLGSRVGWLPETTSTRRPHSSILSKPAAHIERPFIANEKDLFRGLPADEIVQTGVRDGVLVVEQLEAAPVQARPAPFPVTQEIRVHLPDLARPHVMVAVEGVDGDGARERLWPTD